MFSTASSYLSARKIYILVGLNLIFFIALFATYFIKKRPQPPESVNLTVIPTAVSSQPVTFAQITPRFMISPTPAPVALPFDQEVFQSGYRLGDVTIYQTDLERKFSLYYPNSIDARSNLENWRKIADLITSDAIILNEGVKVDLFVPSEVVNIDPYKVNRAKKYFEKQGTSYVSAEMIAVWFHNVTEPKIGIEEAKSQTRQVIEGIREKVVKRELTMREAGNKIAEMEGLSEFDPSYKTNAFVKLEYHKPGESAFTDPLLNDKLWQINPGEISQIFIGRDTDGRGKWWDAYYAVLKITDKKLTQFESVDSLIDARKKEGQLITLAALK